MLFKSTLKLLIVATPEKELLVPIVSNSYKKTLWLIKHRAPEAEAIGVIEGPYYDISFMQVGEINIQALLNQVIRTTNALYTSIGKQPQLPDRHPLDYSLATESFVKKYSNIFSPDEMMIVLGISHIKLFKLIGRMVKNKAITYTPETGPGSWSFYDYFWLNEKYKGKDVKTLDIRDIINRTALQIRYRAHAVGFSVKRTKRIVSNINIELQDHCKSTEGDTEVTLTDVQRDYMISQIQDVVNRIIKG